MRGIFDQKTSELLGGIRIGYTRVCTDIQMLAMQIDALKTAGCVQFREELAPGKQTGRPELTNTHKALRKDNTLVAWQLDRLGRPLPHLIETVTASEAPGPSFESSTEKINPGSVSRWLVYHLLAALAESERNLIFERPREDFTAARRRGNKGRWKPALSPKALGQVQTLMADRSASRTDIAIRFEVSRSTVYKAAPRFLGEVSNSTT